MNLNENLRKIRKENNLSQEQLADKLGVSRQSVSKWESGQAYPEMDKMLKLCEMFNLNIDDLLNQDITQINEAKQSKNNINKFIEDFLNYVTKAIDMFSGLKLRSKAKCLFEQFVIICILLVLFLIIGSIGEYFIGNLLILIPNYHIRNIMFNIIECAYGISYLIFTVILILHIFKIRYLDYYEVVNENDLIDNIENENMIDNQDKIILEKKKEKIVIRDPKHSGYKFISGLLKIFIITLKTILFFIGLAFGFTLIFFTTSLIISFTISKTGLFFIGILLCIISSIIINLEILIVIFNLLFNRKNKIKILFISFICSLLIFGSGIGFTLLGFKEFDVINKNDEKYFVKDVKEFNMDDISLISQYYGYLNYIPSDNSNIKIEVTHPIITDIEYTIEDKMLHIIYSNPSDDNFMEIVRFCLDTINDKKIYDYDVHEINVYTTLENIDKLKKNTNEYYNWE